MITTPVPNPNAADGKLGTGSNLHFISESTPVPNPNKADGQGIKVYRALLTQSGADAPVATILENSLAVIPSFSYISAGQYRCTATGLFVPNKTWIAFFNVTDTTNILDGPIGWLLTVMLNNPDSFDIYSWAGEVGTAEDGGIKQTPLEIRIYP